MLADFRQAFGCAPWGLPKGEALLLLGEVVGDLRSRTTTAMAGWVMPLDLWLQMQLTGALVGQDRLAPAQRPEPRPKVLPAEAAEARALLDQFSAIPRQEVPQ